MSFLQKNLQLKMGVIFTNMRIILILIFIVIINTPALSQEKIIAKELTKKNMNRITVEFFISLN